MKICVTLALVSAAALNSCLVGPGFNGVDTAGLPETWLHALPPSAGDQCLARWWSSFGDRQLDWLIGKGFEANPDMISAALAIGRAESVLRSRTSNLFPTVGVSLGGSHAGAYDSSTAHGRWNGALSASWTPDIWGGTRREVEAAAAALGSSKAAAAATRTALASSIASAYFEWISAKESLRIAQEQLGYQERTYRVTDSRVRHGFASKLDLAEARMTIASTRAQIPAYEAAIKTCEATLAVYMGTTAEHVRLNMPASSVYNRIPAVPTGLPSELLRRRPDIIRAECELHAATANVGVNVARLFPSLSLTGGSSGSAGSDFAGFWKNATWNLSASVGQTLLNRVALNEGVTQAEFSRLTAVQTYRKTVLEAFSEVEKSLISYARLTAQLPQYELSAASSKEAAELSLRRYNAGESDFLNVAAAERAWLSAELNVIAARQNIRMELARLCTALGGGWEVFSSR